MSPKRTWAQERGREGLPFHRNHRFVCSSIHGMSVGRESEDINQFLCFCCCRDEGRDHKAGQEGDEEGRRSGRRRGQGQVWGTGGIRGASQAWDNGATLANIDRAAIVHVTCSTILMRLSVSLLTSSPSLPPDTSLRRRALYISLGTVAVVGLALTGVAVYLDRKGNGGDTGDKVRQGREGWRKRESNGGSSRGDRNRNDGKASCSV